jgi:hypothetical protein
MKNLLTAFEENRHERIDFLRVFDNSENFGRPHLVLSMFRGVSGNIAARKSLPGLKPLLSIQVLRSKTYAVPCAAEAAKDCIGVA